MSCNKSLTLTNLYWFIYTKNKVQKKRKIVAFITKKNRKQLFAKSYCSKKKILGELPNSSETEDMRKIR